MKHHSSYIFVYVAAITLIVLIENARSETIPWVFDQSDQILLVSNAGSWHDGLNWLNFVVPTEDDLVIFDGSDPNFKDPAPPQPWSIYFGDYFKDVFLGGGNDTTIPGGNAVAQAVDMRSGLWRFVFDANNGGSSGNLNMANFTVGGPTDNPTFPGTGPVLEITGNGTIETNTLNIGAESDERGTIAVSGSQTVLNSGNFVAVGNRGIGSFTVDQGATVSSSSGTIGNQAGSNGNVVVEGEGSAWSNHSGNLAVGNAGMGTMSVRDGAAVSSNFGLVGEQAGSHGEVVVEGSGSTWEMRGGLAVGNFGTSVGVLEILDGGQVSNINSNWWGVVGSFAGASGEVTVDGEDSSLSIATLLTIGREGSGKMTVSGGGAVSSDVGHIGEFPGSNGDVTVDGSGSTWTISEYFLFNFGVLNITNGGQVNIDRFSSVGSLMNSNGEVTVSGRDSNWSNGEELNIGVEGTGKLTISDGGSVESQFGRVGEEGGTGDVIIQGEGSTWTILDSLIVGIVGAGNLTVSQGGNAQIGGDLSISGQTRGRSVSNGQVTIERDGSITIDGNLIVATTSASRGTGSLTIESGGAISVDGDTSLRERGTLELQLGGLSRGDEYSTLDILGTLDVNGTLRVTLTDDFIPAGGDLFDILNFAALTGEFDELDLTDLPESLRWNLSKLLTSGELSVIQLGDLDGNGVFDAFDVDDFELALADRDAFLAAHPNIDPDLVADFNGDGVLDAFDVAGFEAALAGAVTIPEPATLSLLALGLFSATRWRPANRHPPAANYLSVTS